MASFAFVRHHRQHTQCDIPFCEKKLKRKERLNYSNNNGQAMHGARKPSGPKTHYGGSGYDFARVLLNLISFKNVYAITDIESYSMSATPT